jgi:hypothetical protein
LTVVCGDNATFARPAAHLIIQHVRRGHCSMTLLSVAGAPFEKLQDVKWNNALPFDVPAFLHDQT